MKTNYKLLLALFCGLFIACSESIDNSDTPTLNEDEVENSNAIGYSIVCDDVTTKGSLLTNARNISSLGVHAVTSDSRGIYIDNVEAAWNGFYSNTTYYWPGGEATLDMFAYTPYLEVGADYSQEGLKINEISGDNFVVSYKVPENIEDQPDFMVSKPVLNQGAMASDVAFSLQHVTAAVSFLISGDDPRGEINQIEVFNIIDEGVVTIDMTDPAGSFEWEIGSTSSDYYPSMSGNIAASSPSSQLAMNTDQYLMMVPQNVDDSSFRITATYSVDYEYPNYITEQGSGTYDFEGEWKGGLIHVYGIVLEDNLPFIVIQDDTTEEQIAAKIAKMIEWGMDELVIVGGFGDESFGTELTKDTYSTYESLLGYAVSTALASSGNSFTSIDLSEVVMLGDVEDTNHLSGTTFGGGGDNSIPTDAQKAQITSITLPADLLKIYSYSFSDYVNLTEIVFPDGCGVIDIAVNTFENCTSLEAFYGSASIQKVLAYAFLGCTSLTTVYIPGAGTSFGQYIFDGCTSLDEIWMATDGEIGDIDNEVFANYQNTSSGTYFDTTSCTLITNEANVLAGNANTYYGNGGGQISISNNVVTITEINEETTSSESFSYTFEAIVLVSYGGVDDNGIWYTVTSVSGSTTYHVGDTIYAPQQAS